MSIFIPEEVSLSSEGAESDEAKEAIQAISGSFDTFSQQTTSAFRGVDSLIEVKAVSIVAGSTATVRLSKGRPTAVLLGGYSNLDDPTEVLATVAGVLWSWDGKGNILVDSVGLTATENYTLTLVLIRT